MTPTAASAEADSSLKWFKSSYSSNDGPECVEVAIAHATAATIHVRDSKDKQRSQLTFTGAAWSEFVGHARRSA
ncbi:hypothetical protein QFZ24_004408 [Streptomyces phaeochromogenes]|jgi:hypothetical protein|uniref:DUF397 domain-containing protein n=1 Tax=Streptomyces TaxID=1883 RepID=UPI00117E9888|nr:MULTISPECIES: DUF397 domain-containing protein [Streptomyces]MDQ0950485.1 hypothetical protein [Streptomyces phaeochromogenes]TRO62362.1 DUF397 domain-containing protein [Streptomyces sp. IB201691-2A2]